MFYRTVSSTWGFSIEYLLLLVNVTVICISVTQVGAMLSRIMQQANNSEAYAGDIVF